MRVLPSCALGLQLILDDQVSLDEIDKTIIMSNRIVAESKRNAET